MREEILHSQEHYNRSSQCHSLSLQTYSAAVHNVAHKFKLNLTTAFTSGVEGKERLEAV